MKINKLLTCLLGVGVCLSAFVSCDNIDEEDRFLPYTPPVAQRKVLLMDFSGTNCTNCPAGARVIESLQSTEGNSFVAVCLQSVGIMQNPWGNANLATQEANEYYKAFNVSALPSLVIDGNVPVPDSKLWSSKAMDALKNASVASIALTADYDADTRKVTVNTTTTFSEAYAPTVSMLAWITESGIVGLQNDNGKLVRDYVHNHIFRKSVNGLWGEEMGSAFVVGSEVPQTFETTLNEKWVAENCHVVVFAFDTATRKVLQCEEVHLIPEAEDVEE